MPKGKGTYGDQVGRPPKDKKYARGGELGEGSDFSPPSPGAGGFQGDDDNETQSAHPNLGGWHPTSDWEFQGGGEAPTYDARNRKESVHGYQEGGGTPQATNQQFAEGQYAEGGEVPEYAWGGGLFKKARKAAKNLQAAVGKRAKKALTRPSQWREWKPGRQRGLGLGKLAAGLGQALTPTDNPMYDKLSDYEGESLGSLGEYAMGGDKSEREEMIPSDSGGFGYAEGGEVSKPKYKKVKKGYKQSPPKKYKKATGAKIPKSSRLEVGKRLRGKEKVKFQGRYIEEKDWQKLRRAFLRNKKASK